MALRHLTDEEIQQYLDGGLTKGQTQLHTHLETCKFCQKELQQYKSLYMGLSKDVNFALSANFANSVVARVQVDAKRTSHVRLWNIVFAALVMIAGAAAVTVYFIDFEFLSDSISKIFGVFGYLNLAIFSPIKNYLSRLDMDFRILALAGLVLILISAIDHFLIHTKFKYLPFSK